ncbi:MAG: response regulator [Methylococcales bacterium]|nr:response regulator [Methylococcales bacterium]
MFQFFISLKKNDPDHAIQSAILRLIFLFIGFLYMQISNINSDSFLSKNDIDIIFISYFFIFLFLLFKALKQTSSSFVHALSIIADTSLISFSLLLTNDATNNPFFLFYVWVIIAYALLYGGRYLRVTTLTCIIEFLIIVSITQQWHSDLYPIIFHTLFLFFLAIFQSDLLKQIHASKQQAIRANEAKSRFLSNVSHELRTPLTGITGLIRLLNDSKLTNEQQNYTRLLNVTSDHLLRLITDLLDFSKLEAGKLTIEKAPVNVFQSIEEIIDIYQLQCTDKNFSLEYSKNHNQTLIINNDKIRLQQILHNLLNNAFKFTEKGKIRVTIQYENNQLILSVADTGIGIKKELIPKLFDPFWQADVSITRKYGGTGLGTSIISSIVELMKGKINVNSQLNEGTEITIILPIEIIEQTTTIQQTEIIAPTQSSNFGPILIAEDNDINAMILQKFLTKRNIQSDVASNGKIAIEYLQKNNHYQLALIDLHMPEMDGLNVIKQWRQQESGNRLPMIILTANVTEEERQNCLQAGADNFLSKPIKPEVLYQIIDEL